MDYDLTSFPDTDAIIIGRWLDAKKEAWTMLAISGCWLCKGMLLPGRAAEGGGAGSRGGCPCPLMPIAVPKRARCPVSLSSLISKLESLGGFLVKIAFQ
eukprot:1143745-Pelagomonas_calceolata.AAC.3